MPIARPALDPIILRPLCAVRGAELVDACRVDLSRVRSLGRMVGSIGVETRPATDEDCAFFEAFAGVDAPNDPVLAVADLEAGITMTMPAGTVVDGDRLKVEVDGEQVEARIKDGDGRWIIYHPTAGGPVDGLRQALAGVPPGQAFVLPPGTMIEYLETKSKPKPRRMLGAWRRKVATPEALLSTLLHDGRSDVLTRETLAACGVLAEAVGARLTAQA